MARALFGVGIGAVIFNKDNQVLLLKRADTDVYKPGTWDLPGGKLEKDEDLEDSIKREVKEEANIEIDVIEPFAAYKFLKTSSNVIVVSIKYVARYKSGEVKLSDEHKHWEWFDVGHLPSDAEPNIITWIKKAYQFVK